jgi:hypothetical protein
MHNSNARFWALGGALAALVAVLVLAITMTSGGSTGTALANQTPPTQPPKTPTATGTPKPGSGGNLTGVFDVWVQAGAYPVAVKNTGLFHCIIYNAHDAGTNAIKSSAQCVADADIADPNSVVPDIPGEGGDTLPGPPPPPPYGAGVPSKGSGTYTPGTDTVVTTTCFKNIGGSLGPNIIAVVTVNNAKAQLTSTGKQHGALSIYGSQSKSQCDSLTPSGAKYLGVDLNIKLHPITGANPPNPVPWRTFNDLDYDNDGCNDIDELDKLSGASCGDDPWNPYDSGAAVNDMTGSYYVLVTAREADACFGGSWFGQGDVPQLYNCAAQIDRTFVPGAYYHCYSYITDADAGGSAGKLTADILCYIDFGPNTNAFPIANTAPGNGTPLAVNPQQCAGCSGDGKSGSAPPGKTDSSLANPTLFADIDSKHTHLTGMADDGSGNMRLWGCFEDLDGFGPLQSVYVSAVIDKYTGQGRVALWSFQTLANCQAGTPTGSPNNLPIEIVKQQGPGRDTDQDGCTDSRELAGLTPGTDNVGQGGLRDPSNPWDYFNPSNNATNRSKDITAVVNAFGIDTGNPLYNQKHDRNGPIPGSNGWNLQPPNGTTRSQDITAAVNSFGHDCGVAVNKTTPTPAPTRTPLPTKPPAP